MKGKIAFGFGACFLLCAIVVASLGIRGVLPLAAAQERTPAASELEAVKQSIASMKNELDSLRIEVTKAVQIAEGLQSSISVAQESANEANLSLARLQLDIKEARATVDAVKNAETRITRVFNMLGSVNGIINLFYRDLSPTVAMQPDVVEAIQRTNEAFQKFAQAK